MTNRLTPAFVSVGTVKEGTGSITVSWGTHKPGDIGILICESEGDQAVSLATANGFSALYSAVVDYAYTRLTCFWCRATSDSMGSPITNDPGDHIIGSILVFRYCDKLTNPPVNAYVTGVDGITSSLSVNNPTTTEDNTLVVNLIAGHKYDYDDMFQSEASPSLTSFAERLSSATAAGETGGIACYTGIKATAGAVNPLTATSPNSNRAAYMSLALLGAIPSSGVAGVFLSDYGVM